MPPFFLVISLIFNTAINGSIIFEPDWNPAIPSDAFVLSGNERAFKSITVQLPPIDENGGETSSEAEGGEDNKATKDSGAELQTEAAEPVYQTFTLQKNAAGILAQFPYYDGNYFMQIETGFNAAGISGFTGVYEDISFEAVFLEYAENNHAYASNRSKQPSVARTNINGEYFFVSFAYTKHEIIETWFSVSGEVLFVYTIFLREQHHPEYIQITLNGEETNKISDFYYDSFGNKTGIKTPAGTYTALYNSKGLRYLERHILPAADDTDEDAKSGGEEIFEQYEITVNERGLPTYMLKTIGAAKEEQSYYEYAYKFDSFGNWIEREEFVLQEKYGVLIPVRESLIKRAIEY